MIRFTTTFETALGTTHTLDILDDDYVSTEIAMQTGAGGVTLSYAAEGTGQDRFEPLIPSNLTFSMIWLNTDTAVTSFLADLVSAQEDRFYVNFYQGAAKSKILWRGKIVQDLIKFEDTASHKEIQITATCGLNSLKATTIEVLNDPDPLPVANIVESMMNCLKQALPVSLWANGGAYLRTCSRWFEDDMTGVTIDSLRHTRLKYKTLFWWFNDDGTIEYMSMYDALTAIAKGFGLRIFMADGRWNAIQVAQYRNANALRYHQYDKRYTSVAGDPDDDGISGASIITTNATIDMDFEPTDYRHGNEWTYLPSVKEVRSTLDFNGAEIIGVGSQFVSASVSISEFKIADVEQISTLGMLITVKVDGQYGGSFGTAGNVAGVGLLRVRIGSSYLKSNGAWTIVPTNIPVNLTCVDDQYWITHSATLTYITNAIPADGEIKITWTAPNFSGATGTGAVTSTSVWVEAKYNIPPSGKVTFTTANTAYQSSSVILDLGDVQFGDVYTLGTARTLQIWNGASWENSDTWQFEQTGATWQFNDLLVLDLMRSQRKPTLKYMGAVFGDASYFHVMYRTIGGDNIRFMPMRCDYNTVIGEWRGEWVQCGYETTSITVSGQQTFEPALKFIGSSNSNTAGQTVIQNMGMPLDEIPSGANTTIDVLGGLKVAVKDGATALLLDTATGVQYAVTVDGNFATGATSVTIDSLTVDADLISPVLILTQPTQQVSATSTPDSVSITATSTLPISEDKASILYVLDSGITVTVEHAGVLRKGQYIDIAVETSGTAAVLTNDAWENIGTDIELVEGQSVRLTWQTTTWFVTGNFNPI